MLPQLTMTGNLTADPELRFTAQGKAVAGFTVACNERKRQPDGTWADGDTTFLKCTVWDQVAEEVCEKLTKGSRVLVMGTLRQRSYETKEQEKRTVYEVNATTVATIIRGLTSKKPTLDEEDPWANPVF